MYPCDSLQFVRFAGDTWVLPFAVTDENGVAIPMQDIQEATFALFDEAMAELFQRTLDSSPHPITASSNLVTVIVPDDVTAELEPGRYLFALKIMDENNIRQTIANGEATVLEALING